MADDPKNDPPNDPKDPPKDPPKPDPDDDDPDDLGERGKRALQAEREARRAADKKARETEEELRKLREAGQSDQEKAIEAAKREAVAETRKAMLKDRVADKIEVAAAGKFRSVKDARLHLAEQADDFVNADNTINTAAIEKAVEKLLKDEPHLAAEDNGGERRNDPGRRPTERLKPGAKPDDEPLPADADPLLAIRRGLEDSERARR